MTQSKTETRMKDAAEAIDRLLSHLGTVLRYIAPGFAALFVVAAVVPDSRPFLSSGSPAVVVLGMLLGPTIYAIHTGAVLRLLWFLIVWLHKKEKPARVWNTMSQLDDQRWLRRASEEGEIQAIQGEMDKWAAMLNLLYCLSYIMILIPLAVKISQRCRVSSGWIIILLGGLVVLAVTLFSEYRITGKEIWLTKQYPNGKIPNQS